MTEKVIDITDTVTIEQLPTPLLGVLSTDELVLHRGVTVPGKDPVGDYKVSLEQLRREAYAMFGVDNVFDYQALSSLALG